MKDSMIKKIKAALNMFCHDRTKDADKIAAKGGLITLCKKNTKCASFACHDKKVGKCQKCQKRGWVIYDCCVALTPVQKIAKKSKELKERDQYNFMVGSKRNLLFIWLAETGFSSMKDIKIFSKDSYYNLYKARPEIFKTKKNGKTTLFTANVKYDHVKYMAKLKREAKKAADVSGAATA